MGYLPTRPYLSRKIIPVGRDTISQVISLNFKAVPTKPLEPLSEGNKDKTI